ncbi:MAG: alpha-L-fucosidase, partial [Anaerolineae bacterium]
KHLVIPELADKVSYARFLHDGSEVALKPTEWSANQLQIGADVLVLELPVKQPDVVVPVIELTLI